MFPPILRRRIFLAKTLLAQMVLSGAVVAWTVPLCFVLVASFSSVCISKDLDVDSRFEGHDMVASFNLEKPISLLEDNILQLENDVFEEIGVPTAKVVVLASLFANITKVVFALDPEVNHSKISPTSESSLKATFESLVAHQSSLRLTKSLFGDPFFFEVLKLPGGIMVIPPQNAFLLQKLQVLFNFTLNSSIYQMQANFDELSNQLKSGLHLEPNENLYVSLSNSEGSTVDPPSVVQSSVLLATGNSPSMPRLKQLAQTITGSNSRNIGLNSTVFGRVMQARLSSILQHSLYGGDGNGTAWSPPKSESDDQHSDKVPSVSVSPLASSAFIGLQDVQWMVSLLLAIMLHL